LSATCPAASFPKILTGNVPTTGVTVIKHIDLYLDEVLLAGGYTNELSTGANAGRKEPWVGLYEVLRTGTQVMKFGKRVTGLIEDAQIIGVKFNTRELFMAHLVPFSCMSASNSAYILAFSSTDPSKLRAWSYTYAKDCIDSDDYLNKLMTIVKWGATLNWGTFALRS